jgi:hypothetical protein
LLLINESSYNYQLKKEGRKNEYEMHKLLALNQRTKMVSVFSNPLLVVVKDDD